MKEFFLKREGIVRVLSLVLIALSVFLEDAGLKIALISVGILGLILMSYFKGQKSSLIIFILLFVIGIIGYYLIITGKWALPS